MQNDDRSSPTRPPPIPANISAATGEVDKVVDPTPHETGHTTPQLDGDLSPRLPHERDESSDSQTSEPRAVILQAHEDLERGLVDTDRGPVMDALYEEQVRPPGGETRDRGAPAHRPKEKGRSAAAAPRPAKSEGNAKSSSKRSARQGEKKSTP